MILSASRRTDIPAFYGRWFINRLKAGSVLVRNPLNHAQLFRLAPLSPGTVDCIVFWTKNPAPFWPCLDALDEMGYRYYFQFTLNPYGRELEPNRREEDALIGTFARLSERLGKHRVLWRYDPIILNGAYDAGAHREHFSRLLEKLSPHTEAVTVSFAQRYRKLPPGLFRDAPGDEAASLAAFIAGGAKARGLRALQCCGETDLSGCGLQKAACVDKGLIERLCGAALSLPKDKSQRPGCGCCQSVDIGAYDTCPAGCAYCYANRGGASAAGRHAAHDPDGELLSGRVRPGETARVREAKSNLLPQAAF